MKNILVKALVYVAVLFCGTQVFAQQEFPSVAESDIAGLKIQNRSTYDGNSLWGYIDGGADLYLEYGFKKLEGTDAGLNGVKYRIDIYKMSDSESAYGIFSIFSFKCLQQDLPIAYYCVAKYQIQFAQGEYYVSVINDKGDDAAQKMSVKIAEAVFKKINSPELKLPGLYNIQELKDYKGSLKFIKGRLGVQNGVPQWEDMFSNAAGYTFYVMPLNLPKGDIEIALIVFPNANELAQFFEKNKFKIPAENSSISFKNGADEFTIWQTNNSSIVLMESSAEENATKNIKTAIDNFLLSKH